MADTTLDMWQDSLPGMWRSTSGCRPVLTVHDDLAVYTHTDGNARCGMECLYLILVRPGGTLVRVSGDFVADGFAQRLRVGHEYTIDLDSSTASEIVWRGAAPGEFETWQRIQGQEWKSLVIQTAGTLEEKGMRLLCMKMMTGEVIGSVLVSSPETTTWAKARLSLAGILRPYLSSKIVFVSLKGGVLSRFHDHLILNDLFSTLPRTEAS
mmetsp:Transcript_54614/g.152421  ORF Transcript_54614/g.152421 Transcript_54614/m.152421 type:complete len:210 (-) Transcript_54614:153-782(-)